MTTADAIMQIDAHLLILLPCFGFLFLCVFLKKMFIYFALAVSWCAVLFNAGGDWSDYLRAAALIIIVWAILQIRKTQAEGRGV